MIDARVAVAPSGSRARVRSSHPLSLLVVGGLIALQLVWVFSVPPFRGSDEFDHAYRAAAAARGQWLIEPTEATRGTGAWLQVPTDIVDAARPECQRLRYTTDVDCVGTPSGDGVRVASGAGRYHPLFYAVVGTPALPFSGVAALYVMRLMTVLISTALFALALSSTLRWARGRWPVVALVISCSPVLVYSSTITAPNGPEIMAALAFWASSIGLLLPGASAHRRHLALAAASSGFILTTLRPLGPLWCLLIVATVVVTVRPSKEKFTELLKFPAVRIAGFIVFAGAVQSTIWVIAMGALKVGVEKTPDAPLGEKLSWAAGQIPLWIFQSIAAFPLRQGATHPAVYFSYLFLFLTILLLALRRAKGAALLGLLLVVTVAVALPYLTSVQSYQTHAGAWQGRYGLPYAVGIVVLASYVLDREQRQLSTRLAVAGLPLFVLAQTISPVRLLMTELVQSPMVRADLWPSPRPWLMAVVAVLASATMWWGAARREPSNACE